MRLQTDKPGLPAASAASGRVDPQFWQEFHRLSERPLLPARNTDKDPASDARVAKRGHSPWETGLHQKEEALPASHGELLSRSEQRRDQLSAVRYGPGRAEAEGGIAITTAGALNAAVAQLLVDARAVALIARGVPVGLWIGSRSVRVRIGRPIAIRSSASDGRGGAISDGASYRRDRAIRSTTIYSSSVKDVLDRARRHRSRCECPRHRKAHWLQCASPPRRQGRQPRRPPASTSTCACCPPSDEALEKCWPENVRAGGGVSRMVTREIPDRRMAQFAEGTVSRTICDPHQQFRPMAPFASASRRKQCRSVPHRAPCVVGRSTVDRARQNRWHFAPLAWMCALRKRTTCPPRTDGSDRFVLFCLSKNALRHFLRTNSVRI